ncbi:MAG: carboxypeptidase-like regulatory domain-containing protein [Sphingobacteriales bacterium]
MIHINLQMRSSLLFCLFIFPVLVAGQYKITGKVLDSADKKSVPGATVFLANASVGTATAVDGTFSLDNVHGGQYDLVVTMVGYTTFRKTILINQDISLPDIILSSKSIALNEVKIRPDPNWARNYEMFRQEFLGSSDYVAKCKILNPELLYLHFDADSGKLTASSSDFIVIENKALGYRVKYQLSEFTKDYRHGYVYFAGTAFFEGLPGGKSQQERWAKNRLKVYMGSSMHFLRSVVANQLPQNGFKVLRLIRKANPDYKTGGDKQYFESLVTTPLTIVDFVNLTDQKGLYALTFKDCLYVMHSKKPVKNDDVDMTDVTPVTTTLIFDKPYALFDKNGIFTDPSAITFSGEWGKSRMAEMLPVDYKPPAK